MLPHSTFLDATKAKPKADDEEEENGKTKPLLLRGLPRALGTAISTSYTLIFKVGDINLGSVESMDIPAFTKSLSEKLGSSFAHLPQNNFEVLLEFSPDSSNHLSSIKLNFHSPLLSYADQLKVQNQCKETLIQEVPNLQQNSSVSELSCPSGQVMFSCANRSTITLHSGNVAAVRYSPVTNANEQNQIATGDFSEELQWYISLSTLPSSASDHLLGLFVVPDPNELLCDQSQSIVLVKVS